MWKLVALVTSVPPNLRAFVLFPALLVFSYTFCLAVAPALTAVGISPFVLAVVAAMGITIGVRMPRTFALMDASHVEPEYSINAFAALFVTLCVLLVANDPLWCQRFFTFVLAIRATFLANALWSRRGDMAPVGGPRREDGPGWLRQSWGQWTLIAMVMMILLNETAIAYGSLTDWVALWAIAPATVYCLTYWSILATAPDDLDMD